MCYQRHLGDLVEVDTKLRVGRYHIDPLWSIKHIFRAGPKSKTIPRGTGYRKRVCYYGHLGDLVEVDTELP